MTESAVCRKLSARVELIPVGEREELLALAEGIHDLIKLGRGDPDLDTPAHIVEAGIKALRNGCTHYTHWAGIPELRQAISEKLERDNGLHYDPKTEIVVTTGVQQAMYVVFQALLNTGDEVLMGDPNYNYYDRVVSFSGGKLVSVPTYNDDFILKPEALARYVTPRTKAIVIVDPNNPTGAVMPCETLEEIAAFAKERDLIVISDEIYEKIIYDGLEHVSIASFPGMHERCIVLNGFSKTYAMTGWRVGYMAAPADFVKAIRVLKHSIALSVNHAAQVAALEALRSGDECVREIVAVYNQRRRYVLSRLDDMGLRYAYPGGAFSVFINISSTEKTSFEFCRDLLLKCHVQMFPGTLYGNAEGYVRFTLLAPVEKLEIAMDRMTDLLASYTSVSKKQ